LQFFRPGLGQQTAAGAVDVSLAAMANGLDDFPPIAYQRVQLVKDAPADKPVAGLA
jgi:hypothetical protein